MKARLLVIGEMKNPDYDPPKIDPEDEATQSAYYVYCAQVPHTIPAPPGMVIEGPLVWAHCLPDNSGDAAEMKPGRIIAEPADEECDIVLRAQFASLTPRKKKWYFLSIRRQQKEIAALPKDVAVAPQWEGIKEPTR